MAKFVTQIVYKDKNGEVLKTNYKTAISALTSLRQEIAEVNAKLEFGADQVKVKLVQALPETLEEGTFYLVSQTLAKSLNIDDVLANINTLQDNLQTVNSNLQGVQTSLNQKIDDTKTELQGDLQTYKEEMTEKLSSVYNYRGSVKTEADLANIKNPKNGDVYNTEDTGMNFAYVAGKPAVEADPENGVEAQDAIEGHWDPLGFDLTHIATKTQLDSVETALGDRIKTLEDKDSKNYDAEVAALQAKDTEHDTAIEGLDTRIDALEADTHKVEAIADEDFTKLAEVQDNTVYLVTEKDTVQDDSGEKTISDVYTLYAGVKEENSQLKTRVQTLESELQAIKVRLQALEA